MVRFFILVLSILGIGAGNVEAVLLTHYGSASDLSGDPASLAGIGNHNNILTAYQNPSTPASAAITESYAQANNLTVGQSFTTTANGVTYNLVYADTVPATYQGVSLGDRIDIYDPNSVLGGANSFSAGVTSVNGGAVGADVGGATNNAVQNINIAVIDQLLSKFQTAAKSWAAPLTKGATTIFWLLALISLVWTGVVMALRRADLSEILVELTRYVMTIGVFFWLLTNGSSFAIAIINSLRMLGGQASGTGQSIFPGDLITLGVQVIQAQMKPINWLFPVNAAIPILLSLIVLIVCILICANIILLLISAWIIAYAGVVVLGFGSSRFTSDIAINYFRTALGVGLSLMTMQLVISIGISFLQQIVQQTGSSGDIGQLIALTVAVIILGVVAHKLPQMVSGMVTGSGHHGGIGAMGLMSAVGASMAVASIARGIAGAAGMGVAGAAGAAGMSAADKLMARISSAESVNGNGSTRIDSPVTSYSTPAARQNAAPSASGPKTVTPMPVAVQAPPSPVVDDQVTDQPTFPDESRGFFPPADFNYPDEPV